MFRVKIGGGEDRFEFHDFGFGRVNFGLDRFEFALFFVFQFARLFLRPGGRGFGGRGFGEGGSFCGLLRALFQIVVVVADIDRHHAVALEGEDVRADAIQKIAVVADHDDAAFERDQGFFQQAKRGEIEVVRGLVENDDVPAALEDFREHDAAALAAAEVLDLRVDAVFGE